MNTEKNDTFQPHAYSPFDDSASGRLHRMGLLREDGTPNTETVSTLCMVYAGVFFDDLFGAHKDIDAAQKTLHQMLKTSEQADDKQRFLVICLQYDAIHKPLPDPVWWMSGRLELVSLFSEGFLSQLQKFIGEEET